MSGILIAKRKINKIICKIYLTLFHPGVKLYSEIMIFPKTFDGGNDAEVTKTTKSKKQKTRKKRG